MANEPSNPQMDEHRLAAEDLVRQLLEYIGESPLSEHCLNTPKRVIKSYKELFAGYGMTPEEALGTTFKSDGYNQMVICKDIEMYSTCSHHMLPFFGRVHIGYVPKKRVVGLSKLARLVEVFSRRLQVQERMTEQIADSMWRILKPKGVMVVAEAKHLCMSGRGIQKQNSQMVTSAIRGCFLEASARAEFMELIK